MLCTPLEVAYLVFVTQQNLDTAATKTSSVCCNNSLRFNETFGLFKHHKKRREKKTLQTHMHTHI